MTEIEAAIGARLRTLQEDWNRGDMEAYLCAYRRDPGLRVVAGNHVITGWEELAIQYRAAYPDPHAMGSFNVQDYALSIPAAGVVIAAGRFEHRFPALWLQGAFTQVYGRADDGSWRIVHEHTSRGAVEHKAGG